MSQVVRERAARLFDSLDDLPNTPPRLPGPTPKKKRSNERRTSRTRTGTGTSITKRRRKGAGSKRKPRKETSLVIDSSLTTPSRVKDADYPGFSKRRSKRLMLNKMKAEEIASGSILQAALAE